MSGRRPTKHEIVEWAATRYELDLRARTLVKTLAYFADDDGDTWSTMETLARELGCSVRTAQYCLRGLEEAGYVRDSGRRHRLRGSTRTVPKYVLRPTIEAEAAAKDAPGEGESMGAETAPIAPVWVQKSEGMGATGCTRIDQQGSTEVSNETSTRAREAFGDLYGRIEAAYPVKGLGWTDPAVARRALADVLGQGVDGAALVAAAAAYAADPTLSRRDFGPVSLQRWLSEGRYRAWMPQAGAGDGAGAGGEPAAGEPRFAGPEALRAAVLAAGGGVAVMCLDRCAWDAATRTVTPQTTWSAGKLGALGEVFEQHGAALAAAPPAAAAASAVKVGVKG